MVKTRSMEIRSDTSISTIAESECTQNTSADGEDIEMTEESDFNESQNGNNSMDMSQETNIDDIKLNNKVLQIIRLEFLGLEESSSTIKFVNRKFNFFTGSLHWKLMSYLFRSHANQE